MKSEQITIIALGVIALFLAGTLGFLFSERRGDDGSPKNFEFSTREIGAHNALTQKQTRIVKSAGEWADLWNDMFPNQMILSAINFNEKMLIAVFQGQKNTGGYSIEITSMKEFDDYIEVNVKEISPGEGCLVTEALSSPYHIVEVKKTNKEIRFNIRQETTECDYPN